MCLTLLLCHNRSSRSGWRRRNGRKVLVVWRCESNDVGTALGCVPMNRWHTQSLYAKKRFDLWSPKKLVIKEIRHRFTSILNRTFSAAQLQPLWCTWKMKLGSRENYCLNTSALHVVYQFTCSCRGTYIDRTWMPEHIPKWLTKRLTLINSRAM